MEKIHFVALFSTLTLFVITFVLINLSRVIMQRDAYREHSMILECLLEAEKETNEFYREMFESAHEEAVRLEETVKTLNDEVAKYHGRKTQNSYFSDNLGEN